MAYLTLTRIAGDPDELLAGYERNAETMNGVGRDHGLIVHVAAKTEDGLLIVNLWPSKDGSESAAQDARRRGVIATEGLEPEQIRPEHHEVANYVVFDRR
jgi:hypothetical protein